MKNIIKNRALLVITSLIMISFAGSLSANSLVGNKDVDKDIITIAVEAGTFSTLATALKEADLVATLKQEGPFTVFAPTDEAFSKLPEGTLENLLNDKDALTNILKYHVVSGNFMAEDVVKYESAKTISEKSFNIKVEDGKVFINDSEVITADIKASNGVIHVIDEVLIPNN